MPAEITQYWRRVSAAPRPPARRWPVTRQATLGAHPAPVACLRTAPSCRPGTVALPASPGVRRHFWGARPPPAAVPFPFSVAASEPMLLYAVTLFLVFPDPRITSSPGAQSRPSSTSFLPPTPHLLHRLRPPRPKPSPQPLLSCRCRLRGSPLARAARYVGHARERGTRLRPPLPCRRGWRPIPRQRAALSQPPAPPCHRAAHGRGKGPGRQTESPPARYLTILRSRARGSAGMKRADEDTAAPRRKGRASRWRC